MNQAEMAWLRFAWDVLAETPTDHLAACQANGGAFSDSTHLSPGYVGPTYRPGGVLVATLAHGPGPKGSAALRLRETAKRWVTDRRSGALGADDAFLAAWRRDFIADQDSNDWWQKRVGWFVHDLVGLTREDLTVINLAPCTMTNQGQGERLARLCQPIHSFARIVTALEPAAIVCPSVAVRAELAIDALPVEPLIIDWNGRTFQRAGQGRNHWAPLAATEIRERLLAHLMGAAPAQPRASRVGLGEPWKPSEPPSVPATPDPFIADPDLSGRGLHAHYETVTTLAQALTAAGYEPRKGPPGCEYDLAWEVDGKLIVAEIKSVTPTNERHQIRLGLGQVLEYRQLLRDAGQDTRAVLVIERAPTGPSWSRICKGAKVTLAWPGHFSRLPGLDS